MLPLRRLALPALLAAGCLSVAGPASADVTGTTSSDDVVLYDHCQRHPISYDVRVGPGTALWSLEIQVFDPEGFGSEGTVINSTTNPPTSGTAYKIFCGSEEPGTYTVRATGFYELLPVVQLPVALPQSTFEVRRAATRTALTAKSLGHGRYRLRAQVREESEQGLARADGVTVRLERLRHGHWTAFGGRRTLTTVHGAVTTTLRARPGSTVRAVVPAKDNYSASASHPTRL